LPWQLGYVSDDVREQWEFFHELDMRSTLADVEARRKRGALYKSWLDNPSAPGCLVIPRRLHWESDILKAPLIENRFKVYTEGWEGPPDEVDGSFHEDMNIPKDQSYRRVKINSMDQYPGSCRSIYNHLTARGIIVAEGIWRGSGGPMWNEVATAQYTIDHDISTLRHVLFTTIVNGEASELIQEMIFDESRGLNVQVVDGGPYVIVEYNTPAYEEMLGIKFGRGVACLVLAAFPRGSMRIDRIIPYIDSLGAVHLRFDIKPVSAPR
jgi:hypothetical protein